MDQNLRIRIMNQLKEPFAPEDIEWRWGSVSEDRTRGQILPYITARAVQERLDDVFPLGWHTKYRQTEEGVICRLIINLPDGTRLIREEVAGYPVAKDNKLASDMRFKGAVSDALKRCASSLGIGRYLYYLEIQWVAYNGKNYVPKNVIPELPVWALPQMKDPIQSLQPDVENEDEDADISLSETLPDPSSSSGRCSKCNKTLSEKEEKYSFLNLGRLLCYSCQRSNH